MLTGIFFGLASATVWATSSLMVKAQAARVDAVAFNAFRMIVAGLLFLALLPFVGGIEALTHLSWNAQTALAVSIICGGAIGDSLYFWSMLRIGVARAMPLSSLYPLFTWAMAVPLLGESITWGVLLGTGVALGGLFLLTPSENGESQQRARANRAGALAALGAAVMWAISTTTMKIGLQDGANIIAINAFRFPVGALALVLILQGWQGKRAWSTLAHVKLPALIGLSLYGTGLGSLVWILSVEHAGAALVNSLSPLIAVPLAVLFLRERVTVKVASGACLAVLGVWLVL